MWTTISLMPTKCGTDRNKLWLRAHHSRCNLFDWCCYFGLTHQFLKIYLPKRPFHPIPSHSTKLVVTSACECVSWTSKSMDVSRNRLLMLHETMLPTKCEISSDSDRAHHSLCNLCDWCCCCCWLLRHFLEDFLSITAIPSIHPIKLNEIGCDIYLRVGFDSRNSTRMGRVEIGSQVLYESMLPECVTHGTNQLHHAHHSRCNAFNWCCWCCG